MEKRSIKQSFKLSIVLLVLVISACTQKKEKETPAPTEVTLQQSQDMYSTEFLNMLNVLTEIRAGRAEQLAASIENSIPAHLGQIATFNESALKTVSFYSSELFYKKQGKMPPVEFETHFKQAEIDAKTVLSDSCYDLLPVCAEVDCIPWPTSLRPVNLDSPNPEGWHYIKDSHCGMDWPKIWIGCGPPVNGPACY